MTMDPKRWVNTIPGMHSEHDKEKYKLDFNRWVSTIPKKDMSNPAKKYSIAIIFFVTGLIFVSAIKNETRSLQKEVDSLRSSIKTFKLALHQEVLEHEFVTSPENISRLAKEYLEYDFVSYKKSQIKKLNGETIILTKFKGKKHEKVLKEKSKEIKKKVKLKITKKIEEKKNELKKIKDLYSRPEKLPGEIIIQVAKRIEKKRNVLKKLYSEPKSLVQLGKVQRWAGVQIVKAFFGIPIIPGK